MRVRSGNAVAAAAGDSLRVRARVRHECPKQRGVTLGGVVLLLFRWGRLSNCCAICARECTPDNNKTKNGDGPEFECVSELHLTASCYSPGRIRYSMCCVGLGWCVCKCGIHVKRVGAEFHFTHVGSPGLGQTDTLAN